MLNGYTPEQAFDALLSIPPTIDHDTRARVGMAAKDAGITFDDYDAWQSANPRYDAGEVRSMWHSFTDGPVKAGTLFSIAKEHGWAPNGTASPYQAPPKPARPPEPPRKPAPGMSASEVYNRCHPATVGHAYATRKRLADDVLKRLRVVPDNDPLTYYRGWLAVPGYSIDGTLQTIEFVPPEAGANKMTLKGSQKSGAMFHVGPDSGPIVVAEGLATASAVFSSTGGRAVACFGSGNIRRVVEALRQKEPETQITIAPDRGKEGDAKKIAAEFNCAVACLPESEPNNFDVNDLFCRDGFDVLAALLEAATEPPKPAPRYKLLGSADIAALPALEWRVRGVLPATGLAALFGPSGSGKSFLALDLACSIVEGEHWFDCRVEAAPVVYICLEGESGFKLRAQAWESNKGRRLPDGFGVVLQPFRLTMPLDVNDMAAVVPPGAVVFVDTLNRAAPSCDENASRDMGEILEAAKRLQALTGGLVVLVHHTGKDSTKGLRGHSSLHAALDAAVEVSRDGDRREWRVAKAKDGADGGEHPFTLKIEALGTDKHGDLISSCVVQEGNSPAADVRSVRLPSGGNQKIALEAVRDLLKAAGPFNVKGSPDTCPPGRPAIELEIALPKIAERLTVAPERRVERAREAVTGLVSRGVLACDKGWIWIA